MSSQSLSLKLPPSASLWASRILLTTQTVAVPLTLWFRPLAITIAVFWLIYRAYQVLHTPLEDLAQLLGFDIPATPIVDLASVKADGCIVHWSLPEKNGVAKAKSKLKYELHLNGLVIESVGILESAVTITGLQPSTYYVVRIALVNEQEFGSRSEPLRFRTRAASTGDCFVPMPDGHDTDPDAPAETLPRVRVYRGLKDVAPHADVEAVPMGREHSNSGLGPKRSITGRRPSPAALGLDAKMDVPAEELEAPTEGVETIQQLTERLNTIRFETDETERQAKEEEEDEVRLKEELTVERDTLRIEVLEKERATRNLKKEVGTLERQNTAAQNERSKQERLLQQKKMEREKLKQDVVRWEREAQEMQAEASRIRDSKAEHIRQIEREKEALRAKQAEEATAMKRMEDEIKETNGAIKRVERAIKNASPDPTNISDEPSLVQQMQVDAEEERQYHMQRAGMQQQYTAVYQKLEAAKRFHTEQIRYLDSVRAQRRRDEEYSASQQHQQQQTFNSPPLADRTIRRGDSQRSRRATGGQSTSESPRIGGGFPMLPSGNQQGASPFPPGLTQVGPAQNAAFPFAPFLNLASGMTLRTDGLPVDRAMTDEEREKLTGGAPMSPGAGAELLPADLFSGDEQRDASAGARQWETVMPLPGLGTLPGLGPGPGVSTATGVGAEREGPVSPDEGGNGSRSPSLFASPQATSSHHNLHLHSPEQGSAFSMMDPDRRSIHSTRSNRAPIAAAGAGSRFSSMFGIKPRTKTVGSGTSAGEDGLALGKAQSHSMPRQDQGLPGLDSASRKRNSSISGVFSDLGNAQQDGAVANGEVSTPNSQASRRRAFGMGSIFGKDREGFNIGGGWPSTFTAFGRRPGSPRPGSTHSNELPRPSMDSSRWGVDTWPSQASDITAGARSSPLSFTAGWPVPAAAPGGSSRLWGSRHPSRRPSVQYGASGSGPVEDIMEDEDSDALDASSPMEKARLAPIGTKPSGKKAVQQQTPIEIEDSSTMANPLSVPRLNPAAKDFKSFFGIKSKDKGRAGSPSTGLVPSSSLASTPRLEYDHHDDSPPDSRKSRSDARSMTTTESSLADSGETMSDLARTPSYTPSYATNSDVQGASPMLGSSGGKESFMQKISRKSSSSKFSLPTFKREKSRLDPSHTASGTAEEDDGGEMALTASVGSLPEKPRESKEANRVSTGRNWSNVLKLGGSKSKKGGGETPSLSGLSLASGTEDGEEGEEVEV